MIKCFATCANGIVEIKTGPEGALEGEAFYVPDCMSAGSVSSLVYLPLSKDAEGKIGWRGKTIAGQDTFIGLGKHPVFSGFDEAVRDAFMNTPIATTTLHFASFAKALLNETQMEYLENSASLESYKQLLDEALCSRTEDNLDDMSFDAISESSLEQDEIREILERRETPKPGL